jgi:HSP20 family molecular chaperone IbpA
MSQIAIERIHGDKADTRPLMQKIESAAERVRQRAQEFFNIRGGECNCATEDWLKAERELLLTPEAKLSEREGKFHIEVAVPGFDARDVQITASENELIVQAEKSQADEREDERVYFSEFGSKSFFRKLAMPAPVNVDRVTAHMEKGILHVTAAMLEAQKIHIAAA